MHLVNWHRNSHIKYTVIGISLAVLFGIMTGAASTYLWYFQDINHNFPAKKEVSRKIENSLKKSDPDFLHATSNKIRFFPIYFDQGNCVLVRPGNTITFNSKEIIFCFDKNWRGPPQRVIDVTVHLKTDNL